MPSHGSICLTLVTVALATGCSRETTAPEAPAAAPSAALGSVAALSFLQVSAGGNTSCGLTTAGLAYCWGANQTRPVAVPGGHHFVQISAGGEHNCAVTSTNEAYCWGNNRWGQ